MSIPCLRDVLRARGLASWAQFALHAVLKFMLPPGTPPELVFTWGRHLLSLTPLPALRRGAPALA